MRDAISFNLVRVISLILNRVQFGWQKRENEYVRLLVEKGEFLWIIPFQLQLNLFHSFDNMEFINNY